MPGANFFFVFASYIMGLRFHLPLYSFLLLLLFYCDAVSEASICSSLALFFTIFVGKKLIFRGMIIEVLGKPKPVFKFEPYAVSVDFGQILLINSL